MICGQICVEPLYWNVPLSCVPPCSRFFGCCALTERLWNCSVLTPRFIEISWFGTRESSDWQSAVSAASRPRDAHLDETSASWPSERMSPPSDPAKERYGLPGTVASAW